MDASNNVLEETRTAVTALGEQDLLSSLNIVLSEVIDVGLDVKQPHHKVFEPEMLHAELARLSQDLGSWARTLAEADEVRGVSPLERMLSVAGRKPRTLWTDIPTDGDVHRTLFELLTRMACTLEEALGEEPGEGIRAALTSVRAGVIAHPTGCAREMSVGAIR